MENRWAPNHVFKWIECMNGIWIGCWSVDHENEMIRTCVIVKSINKSYMTIFYLYQELRPNFVQKLNMISGITHVPETATKTTPKTVLPWSPWPSQMADFRDFFSPGGEKRPLGFGNHLNIVLALGLYLVVGVLFFPFWCSCCFCSCGLWLLSSWCSCFLLKCIIYAISPPLLSELFRIFSFHGRNSHFTTPIHACTTLPTSTTNIYSPWKWMVGILVSLWEGPFSGAMLVSGRVAGKHGAFEDVFPKCPLPSCFFQGR